MASRPGKSRHSPSRATFSAMVASSTLCQNSSWQLVRQTARRAAAAMRTLPQYVVGWLCAASIEPVVGIQPGGAVRGTLQALLDGHGSQGGPTHSKKCRHFKGPAIQRVQIPRRYPETRCAKYMSGMSANQKTVAGTMTWRRHNPDLSRSRLSATGPERSGNVGSRSVRTAVPGTYSCHPLPAAINRSTIATVSSS